MTSDTPLLLSLLLPLQMSNASEVGAEVEEGEEVGMNPDFSDGVNPCCPFPSNKWSPILSPSEICG